MIGTSIVVTARVIAHEAPKLDLGTDNMAPLEQARPHLLVADNRRRR